jgi:fatty-acyl-CoA synthase
LETVELAARGLLGLNIQKGDRVGIWASNCAEWVITQFATAKLGAILVNINPAYRASELEFALNQSQCQTLVFIKGFRDNDYVSTLFDVCPEARDSKPGCLASERLPYLKNLVFIGPDPPKALLLWDEILETGRSGTEKRLQQRESELRFDDPINIQYTSGTTGFPKGAVLSHHNIVNNSRFIARSMHVTYKDKICIPVPFYHCFGMVIGNMVCVNTGATMVIPSEYFDPLTTLQTVAEEGCTILYGVPTMFAAELAHPQFDKFDLRSLRTGVMAGSPCPVQLMGHGMTIAYGLTETSPALTQTYLDDAIELRVSTVGKPLPHTEIKTIDPKSGETVPLGVQGELCARGYAVMKGYYNNMAATSQAIDADGWLHSGDLATMDEHGYLRITGRIKEMVIRGGENIYPREIEEFLLGCQGITAVQVVGIPDLDYGEEIVAWVTLDKNATTTADDLARFCKGKISDYKIPRYFKFIDAFPMTITGKIQKFKMTAISALEVSLLQIAPHKFAFEIDFVDQLPKTVKATALRGEL